MYETIFLFPKEYTVKSTYFTLLPIGSHNSSEYLFMESLIFKNILKEIICIGQFAVAFIYFWFSVFIFIFIILKKLIILIEEII